jgi:hypothetical protein
MSKEKPTRKKIPARSKLRSIIKYKYTPLIAITGIVILFLISIFVPVSINEWTGETEEVSYTTKRVGDASLLTGQEQVKQNGMVGQKTVTYETKRNIWQVISDGFFGTKAKPVEVSSSINKLPVEQIITYGTKAITSSEPNNIKQGTASNNSTNSQAQPDDSITFDQTCESDWSSVNKTYNTEVDRGWAARDNYKKGVEENLTASSLPESEKTSVRFRATVIANDMANKIIDPAYTNYVSKLAELKTRGCKFYTQSYPSYTNHSLDAYLE